MKPFLKTGLILSLGLASCCALQAQNDKTDATTSATEKTESTASIEKKERKFHLGGYGEVALQRMFYNDNVARYTYPETYKDGSHGRFDLPHVVINFSYDFGKGWKMNAEIEFEHGGSGSTYEIENAETGEYETEIEK